MARTNGKKPEAKYKWKGHIQHYFNDEEIANCLLWIEARKPDPLGCIDVMIQKEIGVKFSYSENQDGYFISLQPKAKDSIYYGYTIGLSHVSLERLILIALYVVSELMEHEAIPTPTTATLPDW